MLARARISLSILVLASIAIVLGWTQRSPILRYGAHLWGVQDQLAPADAIVVLGGGIYTRPFAAARLYKENFARRIIIANAKVYATAEGLKIIPHDPEVTRGILLRLGVPSDAIATFGHDVSNTYEEARALAEWAEQNKAKRLIVPTEVFSSRRVRWVMRRQLDRLGVEVLVDGISPLQYDVDHWWQHDIGLIDFQNEILKYVYYRFKYS